jgi:hypothetical protein
MQRYLEAREITFRRQDGSEGSISCRDFEKLLLVRCPGDNTPLLERTCADDVSISCPNCSRLYASAAFFGDENYTQELINRRYVEIVEQEGAEIRDRINNLDKEKSKLLKVLGEEELLAEA